jgi:ATP-dependent RNA helicase DDX18/HAS1
MRKGCKICNPTWLVFPPFLTRVHLDSQNFLSSSFHEPNFDKRVMQEKIVGENYYLNQSAKDAYRAYILAYNSHSMKEIFNVHSLNLKV